MDIYHTVYQTTNLINGKIYIGVHSTKDPNDSYLGSGKYINRAIEKHGEQNFKKDILFLFDTPEEAYEKERELVTEEFLKRKDVYNLKLGGDGGFYILNSQKQNLYGNNGKLGFGGENLYKGRTSESSKERWKNNKESYLNAVRKNQEKAILAAMSKESMEKRKETYAKISHQKGETNSQYGTCWVTKEKPIKIKNEDLQFYISLGYRKGRK